MLAYQNIHSNITKHKPWVGQNRDRQTATQNNKADSTACRNWHECIGNDLAHRALLSGRTKQRISLIRTYEEGNSVGSVMMRTGVNVR